MSVCSPYKVFRCPMDPVLTCACCHQAMSIERIEQGVLDCQMCHDFVCMDCIERGDDVSSSMLICDGCSAHHVCMRCFDAGRNDLLF